MECQICGTPLEDNEHFCPNCHNDPDKDTDQWLFDMMRDDKPADTAEYDLQNFPDRYHEEEVG